MVGRVVRVAQVVVDFISGELLLAEATLHRELGDVVDDGEIRLQRDCKVHVCPRGNPVSLDHVTLKRITRMFTDTF